MILDWKNRCGRVSGSRSQVPQRAWSGGMSKSGISNHITALSGYLFLLDDKLKDPEEKLYLGKSIEITDRVMK